MEIMLTEDQCIGNNKNFVDELSRLIKQGYTIVQDYFHPAIGRVAILRIAPSPKGLGRF